MFSNMTDINSSTGYLNDKNNKYKYNINVIDNNDNILNDYNVYIDDQIIHELPTYLESGKHKVKIDGVCFHKSKTINIQKDTYDNIVTNINDDKVYIDPDISHIKYIHNRNIANSIRSNPIKPKSVDSDEIEFICDDKNICKIEVLSNNIENINNNYKYRITVHNHKNNESIIGKEYYSSEEAIKKILSILRTRY